jgi:hypothetical protein
MQAVEGRCSVLLQGDDGGNCKGNFGVTRKLRCPESCSRNRLVIAALMAGGSTPLVFDLIEAGDEIEAGCLELAMLSAELTSKQKRKGAVCRI